MSGATLKNLIMSGEVASTDLVWREGMSDWRPAAEISDFESDGVAQPAGIVAPPGGSQIPQGGVQIPQGGYHAPVASPGNSGLAIASMVTGIVGLLCLGALLGIPAVIMGHIARGQIAQSGGTIGGGGMAMAGLVCGYFAIGWTVFWFLLIIVGGMSGL